MSLLTKEVRTRRELRQFVTFPEKLYRNHPYWVPALHADEYDTLGDKNPALDNLLLDEFFADTMKRLLPAWRRVAAAAMRCGIPAPALTS